MVKTLFVIILGTFSVYFGLWLFVYTADINQLAIQSEDTLPAMILPVTILKEKTFYADSYYQMLISRYPSHDDRNYEKGLVPFYLKEVTGHYVSAFPLMAGILALPVYLMAFIAGITVTWENLISLSHVTSALAISFSGAAFYLLVRRNFVLSRQAGLLVSIYLFGTVNFAMLSQSLWQHGVLQLFTVLSLLFLYESNKLAQETTLRKKWIFLFLSGLFFGLAVLSRPTAVLFLLLFLALMIVEGFKAGDGVNLLKGCFVYLMGLIPSFLFFVWYNATYYKDIANQGYSSQLASNWLGRFPEGFLGIWLSPSKGILIYSPVFFFALVSVVLLVKNRSLQKENRLHYFLFTGLILLYTLIMSKWKHWYGGWSFGYRMASDVIPFLVLLLVPFLKSKLFENKRVRGLFYLSIAVSIGFELMGMAFFDGYWHGTFDKGFKDTSWLWSVQNSELVFNLRRFLDKIR